MDIDLTSIDLLTLKALYNKEALELKEKLLNGTNWNEVSEQRITVTKLAMELHSRIHPWEKFNPVEIPGLNKQSTLPGQSNGHTGITGIMQD
jgi:hypothetical protein